MLVHRRARRQGLGAALMRAAEAMALECGRTLLVLDAVTGGDAERLYGNLGWQRVGVIPDYALMPDGEPCSTTYFYRDLTRRRSLASTSGRRAKDVRSARLTPGGSGAPKHRARPRRCECRPGRRRRRAIAALVKRPESAQDARWPARSPGHVDQRDDHAFRAARESARQSVRHRAGGRGARGAGGRAAATPMARRGPATSAATTSSGSIPANASSRRATRRSSSIRRTDACRSVPRPRRRATTPARMKAIRSSS